VIAKRAVLPRIARVSGVAGNIMSFDGIVFEIKQFFCVADDPADVFPVFAADSFRRRNDFAAPFELVKKIGAPIGRCFSV